jgi:TIGR03009 family protein
MATRPLHTLLRHLHRAVGPPGGGELTDEQLLDRWLGRRDEAAFELLVWRHGPLVLGACRRLLRDAHSAEDAFQATWLLFVRKAASIRRGRAVAAWLHRVACRVALRARAAAARWASAEEVEVPAPAGVDEVALRDLRAVLDEEIDRLPEHYRRAFILCALEGRTQEQAAALLGCPRGTLSAWLSRGRERLRGRLARRGVSLTAAVAGLALSEGTASAGLPAALVGATLRAAILFAAGAVLPGAGVSQEVTALTKGVLESMAMSKTRITGFALLLLVGAGTVALSRQAPTASPPRAGQEEVRGVETVSHDREPAAEQPGTAAAWGRAAGGLEAGIGFRPGDRDAYRIGESVTFVVYLRNVGGKAVRLSHIETLFAESMPHVEDADGNRLRVTPGPVGLGDVPIVHRTLEPGEQIILGYPWFRLRRPGWRGKSLGPTLRAGPGKYQVSYAGLPLRLNDAAAESPGPPTGRLELEIGPAEAADGVSAGERGAEPAPASVLEDHPTVTAADRWLGGWEAQASKLSTLTVHYTRYETDKNAPERKTFSGTALLGKPNLAVLEERREGEAVAHRKYVCTGKALYQYVPERKVIEVRRSPDAVAWLGGADPFPLFLLNVQPMQLRRRCTVRLVKEDQYYVYLDLLPRSRAGKDGLCRGRLVLARETGLPRQVWLEYPGREVIWDLHQAREGEELDRDLFAAPVAPSGWKLTRDPESRKVIETLP